MADTQTVSGSDDRRSILIVEDEPFIVESLTFLLEREGYHVDSIRDGGAALDHLASASPDLLILDTMIPTENGFDVLRRFRQMPHGFKVPVLVLTAKGQESDRQQMLDLGADEFVTKPFSNQDLIGRIGRLLQPQRSR
ncbi:response regulator transcription factor [Amorphus orientalis]|uniref:DNA-binding response OmpR family regulator n=1 Tax=Amorphus orientalis TaxID=649198 RepID=A0AAE4ATA6_9HYPH|nr:response regulator [Amorphus orientalis]MDQ0315972.1 DNA-binding response OmpR family regulator [Amorphus orientalis]